MNKVWLLAFALAFVPVVEAVAFTPSSDWEEVVEPDEDRLFALFGREIQAIQTRTARNDGMAIARGFHIQTHAVMTATFEVLDDLPDFCRQGVFAEPGTYQAWVRFSNLHPLRRPDVAADFRAMAVKVLDVPGTPLTPGENSLDLMGLSRPIQPARDIHQFRSFVTHSFEKSPVVFAYKLRKDIGFREAARMLRWMSKNLKHPPASLATQNYWSTIPIKFGDYAVKYRFVPNNGEDGNPDTEPERYLRSELVDRMKTRPLRWDLLVQFYVDPERTPIEDAVVVWDTPFFKVGELEFRQGDIESADGREEQAHGDRFLWNAWNAPEEHRPIGQLQRARKLGYRASGEHRGATRP
jgi:hypothetical protein